MKKIIWILLFSFLLSLNAQAAPYEEQYEVSGADKIEDFLTDDAKNIIEDLEIDIKDASWVNKLTPESIFSQIINFLKTGIKEPLKCGGGILAIMLLIAVAGTFEGFKPFNNTASYIFTLCSVTGILLPMFSLIESSAAAIKGISVLMDGFVPIYAGILTVGGKAATATGMSFVLTFAAGMVASLSAFVIVPLMSCYLGVAVVGSVMPFGAINRLGDGIKRAAMWILSLVLTLFLGLLSIQATVNKAADNLGLKTAKFMIGSFIPVAGGALSETLNTLIGSMGLLKSSVGMFAVIAIAALILPVVTELLLWRLTLFGLDIISAFLGIEMKTDILRAADAVIAVLIGVMLFVGALFIISLGIIAGGS